MKRILILLLLISYSSFSQTVYQVHEVEKQAEPVGGWLYLDQFVSNNMQIPFQSTIGGLNGKVMIKGVIEPDGGMTNLEVTKSLDSLCDREVVRLMSLYRAWKPASKGGQHVRQSTVYSVEFNSPAKTNFDSVNGSIVQYYDKDYMPTIGKENARNRSIMPVDKNGNISAEIKFEIWQSKLWRRTFSMSFKRTDLWYKIKGANGSDSLKAYQLSSNLAYVPVKVFQLDGKLLEEIHRKAKGAPVYIKQYYPTGMFKKKMTFVDDNVTILSYYQNGQIKSVLEMEVKAMAGTNEKNFLMHGMSRECRW